MRTSVIFSILLMVSCLSSVASVYAETLPVREYTHDEYPEDPADRSLFHQQYDGRELELQRVDNTHFNFVFSPLKGRDHIAKITFKNVDVGLMTPNVPEWVKDDPDLIRIALTDRQWNRQQVAFPLSSVEISGGDGFETTRLFSAELAKNCLNAGLWEVLFFTNEDGQKKLYYQGWFSFPMDEYGRLFEKNTGLAFKKHSNYLKHWRDPAETPVRLNKLRTVLSETSITGTYNPEERLIIAGEQKRKQRTTDAQNVTQWKHFYDGQHPIRFASFVKPGVYALDKPWDNRYQEISTVSEVILRQVRHVSEELHEQIFTELEVVFRGGKKNSQKRLIVSGFEIDKLPQLATTDYPKGLYMPMGIGVPPFNQSYADLLSQPPQKSPYFSVLLDGQEGWIDHHQYSIDGPVLHRDAADPTKLHLYLLSYERHSLVMHLTIPTTTAPTKLAVNN